MYCLFMFLYVALSVTPVYCLLCCGYTREIILLQNYFSFRRRLSEMILFHRVETCLKLLQNYFRGLLQLMNISNMFINCH